MEKILVAFALFFVGVTFSQDVFSKKVTLLTDNDLYASTRDRYYTNGLFLAYLSCKKSNRIAVVKKIEIYRLGQMIFTAIRPTLARLELHDRPFAGYLFGEYAIRRFYKNKTVLETGIQLGVIGPKSYAEETQNFIHHLYGLDKAKGWKYQIREALALNVNAKYIRPLAMDSSNRLDISSYSTLRLGTVFADISTGFYTRIGFSELQPLSNTVGLHSNLRISEEEKQNRKELFLYVQPMLRYTLYDATIQGSFLRPGSPVTFDVLPVTFHFELGILYAAKRFHYGYTFSFHTKKWKNNKVQKSNFYGGLHISYSFR